MGQGTAGDSPIPESLSPGQLRWLRNLHEGLAGGFATAVSALLRASAEVSLVGVDQRTYGEFLDLLDLPACCYVLKATALAERLMLAIEPEILYEMIDRLLGGGGSGDEKRHSPLGRELPGGSPRYVESRAGSPHFVKPQAGSPCYVDRPLSEIELRLANRIVGMFLAEARRAWGDTFDLKLDILQVDSEPRLLRVLPTDEMVVLVAFELTLGGLRGMMRLCLPCRAVQRIESQRTSGAGKGHEPSFGDPRNRGTPGGPRPVPSTSSVELEVTLAETQIAVGDLDDLRVGDIIATETAVDDLAVVSIKGEVGRFRARPGVYQGRKAVRIVEPTQAPASEAASPIEAGSLDQTGPASA